MTRKNALASTLLILLFGALTFSKSLWATTIEGYTPAGQFQTVFVSADGRLFVSIDSSTPQHVTVDGGTITAVINPVQVYGVSGGPVIVAGTFTSTGTISVAASSSTTPGSAQFAPATSAFQVLTANSSRKQSVVCNYDPGLNVYLGASGVTSSNGFLLPPSTCLGPDNPSSFQGNLYAVSTAATAQTTISVLTFQ